MMMKKMPDYKWLCCSMLLLVSLALTVAVTGCEEDGDGQTFVYEVSHLERLPWRRRDAAELERHSDLLYAGGPERLTLVTCWPYEWPGNSHRVIVVARPPSYFADLSREVENSRP